MDHQWSRNHSSQHENDEEDPFAVFGDDDDETEDEETGTVTNSSSSIPPAHTTTTAPLYTIRLPQSTNEPQRIILHDDDAPPLHIPDWPAPLHRRDDAWEMVKTQEYGRAVRAKQALPAGTLLLVETPLWDIMANNTTTRPTDDTRSATEILYQGVQWLLQQQQKESPILPYVQQLHPTREQVERVMNDNTSDDIISQTERDQIRGPMERLQDDARLQQFAADLLLDTDAMTTMSRYYLIMQYNLLRTGLYLYVALWNHQHQTPNCIKLGNQIWTCRSVEPREMLTIDYVPEISSRRAAILWEHHKFRVIDKAHDIPLPSWVQNYESVLQEFQEQYQLLKEQQDEVSLRQQHLEWAMALEQAILELLKGRQEDSDLYYSFLWIPCRILYLQVGQFILASSTAVSTSAASSAFQLTPKGRIALLERLLEQTQQLLQQQQTYYGPDHLHLATTYDELVQLCQYFIRQDPSRYHAELSPVETMYRKQHERIRSLYPDISSDQIPSLVQQKSDSA